MAPRSAPAFSIRSVAVEFVPRAISSMPFPRASRWREQSYAPTPPPIPSIMTMVETMGHPPYVRFAVSREFRKPMRKPRRIQASFGMLQEITAFANEEVFI